MEGVWHDEPVLLWNLTEKRQSMPKSFGDAVTPGHLGKLFGKGDSVIHGLRSYHDIYTFLSCIRSITVNKGEVHDKSHNAKCSLGPIALLSIEQQPVVADNHVRSDPASGMVGAKDGKSPMLDVSSKPGDD